MRVAGSSLAPLGGPLEVPVGNTAAAWPRRDGLLLTLDDGEGAWGVGEASPLPGYSPDSLVACRAALSGVHLRLGPIDERGPDGPDGPDEASGADRAACSAAQRALLGALAPLEAALAKAPSARFALESALLDLLGRRAGVSAWVLLAGNERGEGGPAGRPVPLSALLDPWADGWPARAEGLLRRGTAALKIKVGRRDVSWGKELERLLEVRAAVGAGVELRLDANGAWSLDEARARLAALSGVSPAFVEEPTRGEGLLRLGRCGVPWAADESLLDAGVRARAVGAPGCAALVLKPALLGLLPARALALSAQRAGVGVVVTHLFDGPVALAAASELALSLPAPPLASGLGEHDGLRAYPDMDSGHLSTPGLVLPSGRPGLGLRAQGPRPAAPGGEGPP
jgi:L-alanine-DL-glutamate epimerase-like enolase superfamily enzyme